MTESVGEVLSTHFQSSRKDLAALMASKGFRIYPTVPQQLHPLRVESIRPGEGSHNDLVAVSLEGHVDVEALTKAVKLLVGGHEALRTFFTQPPTPHMVVAERLDPPFRHVVGCSPDEARSIAVSMLKASSNPFELGCLHECTLASLSEDQHVLFVRLHHLISDGHTHGIYIRDLLDLYRQVRTGQPSAGLKNPSAQFGDYALECISTRESELRASNLTTFASALASDLAPLSLLSGPDETRRFKRVQEFSLPLETLEQREKALRVNGYTLPMAVLAICAQAVAVEYGTESVRLGTPFANRSDEKFLGTIGLFASLGVLPVSTPAGSAFETVLESVRDKMLRILSAPVMPLSELVAALRVIRPDFEPRNLFDVTVAVLDRRAQVWRSEDLQVHELNFHDLETTEGPAMQALHFSLDLPPLGGLVVLRLESDFDRVSDEASERILQTVQSKL